MTVQLLTFLGSILAIPDEFPGYFHYRNVNMAETWPSPIVLTRAAFKTECDTNASCTQMNSRYDYPASTGYLVPASYDSSMDTYYKNSSCGDQCASPTPTYVSGGLYAPDTIYMKCSGCKMKQTDVSHYLNNYQMPPSQCATACDNDKRCAAMSITSDRQNCYTYNYPSRWYDAYLKVSPLFLGKQTTIK